MKEEIKVPQLGESITEAVIGNFLKASGSTVQEGDEVVEIETEKVNQVLYAPCSGLLNWSVNEGESVKIGAVLGTVDTEAAALEKKPEAPSPAEPQPPKGEAPKEEAPQPAGKGKRQMQEEFIAGLQKQEPLEKREAPAAPPSEKKGEPKKRERANESRRRMTKIRQTIANRLVDALHTAAMLTTFNEVDMSAIIALRAKYKESFFEKHGVKLGFMSFFVKAIVEGLKAFPDLNSYIEGDEIVQRNYFDIGIAVGTERGLVVPVVRGCDALSFSEIEREIVEYAKKAHERRLSIEDLEGGGFTITNGGVYGSLLSTPILNPPQVGILGMHKIMKRAVVVDEQILIRPMMYLALSYDHRIVDGKEAVSFLVHIKEILEDPSLLALE